jgi:hypothetical protein
MNAIVRDVMTSDVITVSEDTSFEVLVGFEPGKRAGS